MTLVEFLEQNGIPLKKHGEHHHSSQGWVSTDCPLCSPGRHRYRLGFELNSGRTNCWSCGIQNGAKMLAQLCQLSFGDAIDVWKSFGRYQTPIVGHRGALKLPPGLGDLSDRHKRYLSSRGFSPQNIINLWQIQGMGLCKMGWRIFIPIFDQRGQQVSWTTRSITPKGLRYISAKSEEETIPHKSILYGAHLIRHTAVIVEGPLDVWAIGPGAAATCGTGFSSEQMARMSEYPIRIICFDGEDAAQKRAEELCKNLSLFPGITENVVLETGKDPAEADPMEIDELRKRYLEHA